jgi:Zn-dependent M28 family amino/carboxypeptidase
VLWGVEEIGLLGSKAYVEKHRDELKNIRFYLNMDGAGGVRPKDIVLHEWPELQATFEGYREQMALDFATGQSFHSASDHYPLLLEGVATGGIEAVREKRSGRGYGHTMHDTVDKLTLTDLRDAASLAARLAFRIANDANWPVSNRDDEAVQELLNQPAREELQAFYKEMNERYGIVT